MTNDTAPGAAPLQAHVRVDANLELGHWPLAEPGFVAVAAGGTVTFEFHRLDPGDRPAVRVVAAEPLPGDDRPPLFYDPFETLDREGHVIVARTFPEARGRYRYVVEVEAGERGRKRLVCSPARMGGLDVGGPPP